MSYEYAGRVVGEGESVDDNAFVRCRQAGVSSTVMGVGRSDGSCRVSKAGGVCLRRDWSTVISKACWRRKREERG